MKRFYGDVLGIEATNQNWTNAWAVFDTGDVRFALHAIPAGIAEKIEIAYPPVPREQEPVKLIFEVKELEGAGTLKVRPYGVRFHVRWSLGNSNRDFRMNLFRRCI